MKKSKERREDPLGTKSYQTSSKRSPPFWLLIVARKLVFFWHQSEGRTAATVWNWSGKTLSPGAFLVVFTFLRATFFRPFRLSLVPTLCPWVSEDGTFLACSQHFRPTSFLVRGVTRVSVYSVINKRLLTYHQVSNQTLVEVMHSQAIVSDNIICFTSSLHARWTEGKKEVRLRVAPLFSSGIVDRAKRERA